MSDWPKREGVDMEFEQKRQRYMEIRRQLVTLNREEKELKEEVQGDCPHIEVLYSYDSDVAAPQRFCLDCGLSENGVWKTLTEGMWVGEKDFVWEILTDFKHVVLFSVIFFLWHNWPEYDPAQIGQTPNVTAG